MSFDLGSLLQQFTGAHSNPAQAEKDFDQIAQSSSQNQLSQGLSQAFRSEQTPPFAQMAAQLFGNSDPTQRAGMLNHVLATVGPGVLASLGGMFGGANAQPAQVTPEQAAQMTPEQVRQIAEQAEQHNPSIVDRMGDFYAQHPALVKGIGGAALAIALGHMAQGMKRN
jgi:hypothetical protein